MDPRLVDQLLQLILPVALFVLALNIGAHMTGFGRKFVKQLTGKVVSGLLAIGIIWIIIAAICESLSR